MTTTAELAYGASAVLITISLVLLNYAWKHLRGMLSSLPEGERRVKFFGYIRSIQNEREKDKAILILFHFIGCMFIAGAIALSVFAIVGVTSVLLGYKLAFYQNENYEVGKACLFIGVGCFSVGIFWTSLTYISMVISVITGRPDILTTDLSTLPPVDPRVSARRRIFEKLFLSTFILIFILLAINVFEAWVNILIVLGLLILFYIGYRIIVRFKKQQ